LYNNVIETCFISR